MYNIIMHSGRGIFLSLWSALSGFVLSYLADAKVMKETDMTKKKRQKNTHSEQLL